MKSQLTDLERFYFHRAFYRYWTAATIFGHDAGTRDNVVAYLNTIQVDELLHIREVHALSLWVMQAYFSGESLLFFCIVPGAEQLLDGRVTLSPLALFGDLDWGPNPEDVELNSFEIVLDEALHSFYATLGIPEDSVLEPAVDKYILVDGVTHADQCK